MIAISLKFPAGRYHATPWGRHVNEGVVEWPPSPWRVLRGLVAVWKRTLPDLSQAEIEPILRALASPPRFVLPPASTGHTRHYMPWHKGWTADEPGKAKTKVFDAFVAMTPETALVMIWQDADLRSAERALLARLLANMNFLGRAESWCEAALLNESVVWALAQAVNCEEFGEGQSLPPGRELVRTLCVDPESAFADDAVVEVEIVTQGRGRTKVETQVRHPVYEPNWQLCMETLRLHEQRWSDPPGSVWVQYSRPSDCFEARPAHTRLVARAAQDTRPQIVRFALDSAVLPPVTSALPIAEALRAALIRRLVDVRGRRLYGSEWSREKHKAGLQTVHLESVITGKDETGAPRTGHAHAYFLPSDEDGDGRIDHVTVFARAGLADDEMHAVQQLRVIRPYGRDNNAHPLRVLLLGHGAAEKYQPGPLKPSHTWVSATPYIATRRAKARGRDRDKWSVAGGRANFLIADLRRQVDAVLGGVAAGSDAVAISPVEDRAGFLVDGRWRPAQFKRCRNKRGDDGNTRLAGAFRITFPTPVAGPIALGYGAHFGLGLFMPERAFPSRT